MLVLVFLNRQVNVPMNEHKKAKIIGDHVSFFTFQQFRFTSNPGFDRGGNRFSEKPALLKILHDVQDVFDFFFKLVAGDEFLKQ